MINVIYDISLELKKNVNLHLKPIYIYVGGGLGNRLMSISNIMVLSLLMKREPKSIINTFSK